MTCSHCARATCPRPGAREALETACTEGNSLALYAAVRDCETFAPIGVDWQKVAERAVKVALEHAIDATEQATGDGHDRTEAIRALASDPAAIERIMREASK